MSGREFFANVDGHAELEWLGARENETTGAGEVLIRHIASGAKHVVNVSAILENTWEEIEVVLTGKRPAKMMTHLTRIVGYYSRLQNWNKSKMAELRDRHAGDYAVAEPAAKVELRVA